MNDTIPFGNQGNSQNSQGAATIPFGGGNIPSAPAQKPQSLSDSIWSGLAGGAKAVGNFLTSSEQGLGKDISSAITAPSQIDQATTAASDQNKFIQTLQSLKTKAQAAGQDTSHYDKILANQQPAQFQMPDIPSTGKVLTDAAGTALDAASFGTYGATKTAAMKTGELASKGVPTAITAGEQALNAAKTAITGTPEEIAAKQTAKIVDMVSPKLTAKESAQALATRGGTKTGILGTIKANIDPAVQRIADTVSQFVPDFNPKASLVENINATKGAIGTIAQDLKSKVIASGKDAIYSFKELGSTLKNVEKPTMIAADQTLNRAYDLVVNKAMDIARSTGGKVSDLLPMRQELDSFIEKQFPNLYSSETLTPMRQAVKGIRNAITDFTINHLPSDVGMRESYMQQTHLFDAVENMSEKAASGATKEVGTNAIQRAAAAHPTATKVIKYGAAGVVGGTAVHATGL